MEQSKTDEILPDRIAEIYAGQKILVTGGTGFLGKVLIEKFLRCLPDIAHIYVLVRSKKGKDPKHRLDEIFNSPVSSLVARLSKRNLALSKRARVNCTTKAIFSRPIDCTAGIYLGPNNIRKKNPCPTLVFFREQ